MFKKELTSKKNIWKNTNKNYAVVRNLAKINLAFGGKKMRRSMKREMKISCVKLK